MELHWLLAPPLPDAVPRQRVLYHRLRDAILCGRLAPGASLPSSRSLAASLGIARNTVLFAYEQLVAEGCLIADRQGTRVVRLSASRAQHVAVTPSSAAALQLSARAVATQAHEPVSDAQALPLSPGVLDFGAFPFRAWRGCLERAWRDVSWRQLGYAAHGGDPALRAALASYLGSVRGLAVEAAQIVITSGSQAALDLCARLLADHGDTVWVEPGLPLRPHCVRSRRTAGAWCRSRCRRPGSRGGRLVPPSAATIDAYAIAPVPHWPCHAPAAAHCAP